MGRGGVGRSDTEDLGTVGESPEYGKKYCHTSPTVEESILQEAIVRAIQSQACQNTEVLQTLRLHIGMGLNAANAEDNSMDIEVRIAEINATFKQMVSAVSADNESDFDEEKLNALMMERQSLQQQLDRMADAEQKRKNARSRLDEIYTIMDGLKNHPMEYDDHLIRQILECVVVESKTKIKVVFVGGLEVEQEMM